MSSSLVNLLKRDGQFPPLNLIVIPLDQTKFANSAYGIRINTFLSYTFRNSIVQPVDAFSFTFAFPQDADPFRNTVQEGDIAQLVMPVGGKDYILATGIIETIEIEVTSSGEQITVQGRDLMSQLDDQHVLTVDGGGTWGAQMTPQQVFENLRVNTRFQRVRFQGVDQVQIPLVTEPGESKLQVLARYLEPFNALVWCDPDGTLVMGKPGMWQVSRGNITCNLSNRDANVLSIRSTRASGSIPNFVVPIWSSQVNAQVQVAKQQGLPNNAPGPKRLLTLGHRVVKTVVMSDPSAGGPQIAQAAAQAQQIGLANKLQSYALRELARQNMRENIVQAIMPGHLDTNALPYTMDTVYTVDFDRDQIYENMYVYEVEYSLSEKGGPKTLLMLTKMGTICAGVPFQSEASKTFSQALTTGATLA